jgi:hypothetical protein
MSTIVEFWCADSNDGEALIRDQRCKVMDALAQAATARPQSCVLVTFRDTRPSIPEVRLWIKPGYSSSTIGAGEYGVLNIWKPHI